MKVGTDGVLLAGFGALHEKNQAETFAKLWNGIPFCIAEHEPPIVAETEPDRILVCIISFVKLFLP